MNQLRVWVLVGSVFVYLCGDLTLKASGDLTTHGQLGPTMLFSHSPFSEGLVEKIEKKNKKLMA